MDFEDYRRKMAGFLDRFVWRKSQQPELTEACMQWQKKMFNQFLETQHYSHAQLLESFIGNLLDVQDKWQLGTLHDWDSYAKRSNRLALIAAELMLQNWDALDTLEGYTEQVKQQYLRTFLTHEDAQVNAVALKILNRYDEEMVNPFLNGILHERNGDQKVFRLGAPFDYYRTAKEFGVQFLETLRWLPKLFQAENVLINGRKATSIDVERLIWHRQGFNGYPQRLDRHEMARLQDGVFSLIRGPWEKNYQVPVVTTTAFTV